MKVGDLVFHELVLIMINVLNNDKLSMKDSQSAISWWNNDVGLILSIPSIKDIKIMISDGKVGYISEVHAKYLRVIS
jgi:hypothetical protein